MSTIRVIGREDIQKVFTVTAALRAVESAYAGKSAGTGSVWPMVFHEFDPGHADLDIKSGDLASAGVFGLKVVSWYDNEWGYSNKVLMLIEKMAAYNNK